MIDWQPYFPKLVATFSMAVGTLTACGKAHESPPEFVPAGPATQTSTCGEKGVLQAMFTGAIVAKLDWPDSALRCESMPRPDAEGVRLRFSGDVDSERLAIIIALPDLSAGETGDEFDSNVTISVEGSGRFFSTPNLGTCWSAIAANQPLEDGSGRHNVLGALSCVGPLGEINGDGFIDIRNLKFSGVADWSAQ